MDTYPRLAAFMASNPEAMIFRSFEGLSTLLLLHLQAELVHLEAEFSRMVERDDASDDPERQRYGKSWKSLAQQAIVTEPFTRVARADTVVMHPPRLETIRKAGELLKAYRKFNRQESVQWQT